MRIPLYFKNISKSKAYIAGTVFVLILGTTAISLTILDNAEKEKEISNLFEGECSIEEALDDIDRYTECKETASNKILVYRKISDDKKMEMLIESCLNQSIEKFSEEIQDQLDIIAGRKPLGNYGRCKNQAISILAK
jgi:hypothetical protein